MEKNIFENYDAFYNMVLCTTIMSNAQTEEYKKDAEKIIQFIGEAYKFQVDFINNCKTLILDKLITLGLITDQQAVYSSREFGDNYSDDDALFDIKGDVLSKLQDISRSKSAEINDSWFDYSHYKTYQANVRFSKINTTSSCGNLIATRQVGILKALGIGCVQNLQEAINRLSQCVFWGDIPSMHLLAHAYHLLGNEKKSLMFYELAVLSDKYLLAGSTVLPADAIDEYSEEARLYYIYISTIKQDIIYALNKKDIDFSFIEAITSDNLDYFQIMEYINNYESKEWKNVTNAIERPSVHLGFK